MYFAITMGFVICDAPQVQANTVNAIKGVTWAVKVMKARAAAKAAADLAKKKPATNAVHAAPITAQRMVAEPTMIALKQGATVLPWAVAVDSLRTRAQQSCNKTQPGSVTEMKVAKLTYKVKCGAP